MVSNRLLTTWHAPFVAAAVLILSAAQVWAQEPPCGLGVYTSTTNDFYFTATSAEGAVGDIVALDLSVTVDSLQENLVAFSIYGCYDGGRLELLRSPAYSTLFDEIAFMPYFSLLDGVNGSHRPDGGPGFMFAANFTREGVHNYFLPGSTLPLATLFFRVRGNPGDTASVGFCDDFTIPGGSCGLNDLFYAYPDSETATFLSQRHVPGEVHIVAGEPTHPNPPPLPPDAKVYPEQPAPETADIRFELQSPAVTHAGATDVPFDLFVTSNYEFSGFMTSLVFPAQYLELTHVDEPIRPGVVAIDNKAGSFGILMSNSRRRAGPEGERVHLATLHFNVKEAASEVSSLSVELKPAGNFLNWLAIQFRHGVDPDILPTTAEVSPVLVGQALVGVQTKPTAVGVAVHRLVSKGHMILSV